MSVFEDEAIQAVVLDEHTSILEGSIGAVQRRIMVLEKDKIRAEAIVEDLVPGELKGDG
ncbi:putative signal transducing protein [Sneathiella aquimaris]